MDVENEGLRGVEANLITNERSACRGDPYTPQLLSLPTIYIAQTLMISKLVEWATIVF